ncbi:MAG TPA: hypothetical protein VKU82_03275, partial [Planctomycetaceae bacterium]|nr:hypothetical protein [Planctomycetaceae bacterium]
FVPDGQRGTKGPIGVGEIQRDGTYRVFTDPRDAALAGAIVGFHRIRVTQMDGDFKRKIQKDTSGVPAEFASESTSGLAAEIKRGVSNTVDLDLKRPSGDVPLQPAAGARGAKSPKT